MSIFHAFYVMSYTATTIGFGEIPYPFTDAQRLWVTFSIYLSVIGWAYTLGSVIALANDATFRALLARSVFKWRVRGHRRAVLRPVRLRPERRAARARARPPRQPAGHRRARCDRARGAIGDPGLRDVAADAVRRRAARRRARGLRHPQSALPRPDRAGRRGRASTRRSRSARACSIPAIPIVARAKSEVAKVNLESFGGVAVINPFETFAANLGVSLRAPEILQVEEWLTATPGSPLPAVRPAAARALGARRLRTLRPRDRRRCSTARASSGRAFDPLSHRRHGRSGCCTATTPRTSCATRASRAPTCWSPAPTSTR